MHVAWIVPWEKMRLRGTHIVDVQEMNIRCTKHYLFMYGEKNHEDTVLDPFFPTRPLCSPASLSGGVRTFSMMGSYEDGQWDDTCLPLPNFSCSDISVLDQKCGNNPLSSHPFLYRHDPENEEEKTVKLGCLVEWGAIFLGLLWGMGRRRARRNLGAD